MKKVVIIYKTSINSINTAVVMPTVVVVLVIIVMAVTVTVAVVHLKEIACITIKRYQVFA
jgi:hypothetical protein